MAQVDKKAVDALRKKKEHQRTEEDWQALSDARTLIYAEEIKADESRLASAQVAAAVLLEEQALKDDILNRVVNGTI